MRNNPFCAVAKEFKNLSLKDALARLREHGYITTCEGIETRLSFVGKDSDVSELNYTHRFYECDYTPELAHGYLHEMALAALTMVNSFLVLQSG